VRLAVANESRFGETRVSLVPQVAGELIRAGLQLEVETGAGEASGFEDSAYQEVGAEVVGPGEVGEGAEAACVVRFLDEGLLGRLAPEAVVVGLFSPYLAPPTLELVASRSLSLFSLELLPRITRAQPMDALSSQATVSGYRAALLAATRLPRFFPMLMTAAGTVPPAKVFILGAGVAGLQAIATARRLGAVVWAHDVREASRGEVESLGARFVELPPLPVAEGSGGYAAEQPAEVLARQREVIAPRVADSDVVITTAAVPGRRAPILLTREMVEVMRPGSVVVDLAADSGGNCEATVPGEEVRVGGAVVVGLRNPPGGMPMHASQLYARNVASFLLACTKEATIQPDMEDEIFKSSCVTLQGAPVFGPLRESGVARQ
jgi:NAD(P) transhydrogenase subunit alpha